MCNDSSLLGILTIVKKTLLFIQIIVPIILIIFGAFSFIKLIKNPEEKKGLKKVINQFLAAAIIFFIPMIVNVLMTILGEKTSLSSCWIEASDEIIINRDYKKINGENKDKKTFIPNAEDYEKGLRNNCPIKAKKTRTSYNSATLKADTSFSISARQNFESGMWYTTQVAAYDCQCIIAGQHKSYTVNGVMHKNEGGRVAWFDIKTGENIANVSIGAEGTHMARLAYDSDRNIVLIGSGGSDNLLQIDNKTKTIMEGNKYSSMTGGGSFFIKYDSYNHQLVGLSRNVISYYKYNASSNTYDKTGSITLESTSKWDPQNFNVDGQVIYIANSNPHWGSSNYGVIVYDMKTGKMLENHKLDGNVTGGHIEDVIVDTEGNLWLITPAIYWKAMGYVANAFSVGP